MIQPESGTTEHACHGKRKQKQACRLPRRAWETVGEIEKDTGQIPAANTTSRSAARRIASASVTNIIAAAVRTPQPTLMRHDRTIRAQKSSKSNMLALPQKET